MLSGEPNLVRVKDPITVVGDIHGQYYDFLKLLEVGGKPDSTQYLFLGDYVDRGSFSIPVVLLLYALKLNFPKSVTMLRGNHECRQMTSFFNFKHECVHKYDLEVYNAFMESFDNLPLAALINNKFLAVHGGLSPALKAVHNVLGVNRYQETPRSGLFCDLLWADPIDEDKEENALARTKESYIPNDVRGCSFFFYYNAAVEFLDKNNLLSVIRAHEAQLEGYKMHQTNSKSGFPTVITIFSAPNYCDVYNNKAAVLKFKNNTLNIQQFNFSPHPYHLSCFMDVFAWSIPFVSEKVTEMLYALLDPSTDKQYDDVSDVVLPEEVQDFFTSRPAATAVTEETQGMTKERADALRKKVQSVGRLMRVFKTLREQNELIVQLKGVSGVRKSHAGHPRSSHSCWRVVTRRGRPAGRVGEVQEGTNRGSCQRAAARFLNLLCDESQIGLPESRSKNVTCFPHCSLTYVDVVVVSHGLSWIVHDDQNTF